MLNAIATKCILFAQHAGARRLPKQVTDFVARTNAEAAVGEFLPRMEEK